MPIAMSRYVDITSGVGAAANVATRNLNGLIVTGNTLCPSGTVKTFTSAADVGIFFGTSSEEYARAVFYFGWISKNITATNQLNFYFWNNGVATASLIFGKNATYSLSSFTGVSNGDMTLTMLGVTVHVTAIDFTAAASLAAVAAALQVKIRAANAAWTAAVVSYSASGINGQGAQFNLASGGTAGVDTIAVVAGGTNDVAVRLGWLTGATLSNGTAIQDISTNLNKLIDISNNFGSFCYTTTLAVSEANLLLAAAWNNSLTPNNQFLLSIQVSSANAATWSAAFRSIGGATMTLASASSSEYPEMVPMMILGATDYTRRNSVQNYMFQQFNLTPPVTTDADADIYDPLLINYYGQTETAGQNLAFYQRGVMFGLATQPADQNIYANELWLKDALQAAIMTLLLSLANVSANAQGVAQILSVMQSVINQALFNGSISVGKPLNATQQLYIAQATGDPTAWQQVQNIGYWVTCVIVPTVNSGVTTYTANYVLIYSKDDVIRKVVGSDILI